MTFFVTVLWAFLSLGNPAFGHSASPDPGYSSVPTAHVHGVLHGGSRHAMDGSAGGPG